MTRIRTNLLFLLLAAVPFGFAQRGPAIEQQLTFGPYHPSGIYNVGELVGWTVTPGPAMLTYSYKWTIRRNNAVVLKEGKLDLSSGKDTIEITGDQPEMLYVAVEPYATLGTLAPAPQAAPEAGRGAGPAYTSGNTGRNNGLYAVGAAVAPAKLGLATPRPNDFDAFWNGKLAAQAKIPINPVLTPVPTDVPGVDLNMFAFDALGSTAHGYIAKPAREGKFPALIQLQYAGVYALNARGAAQRAAEGWLFINVDSHDKLPSDPSGNVPRNYQAVGNTDREKSYFLNMYLRDSRALDYLLTRPDWDGKTIILTGGSMGGQQSLVLAGLRPEKITAALVCVPAGQSMSIGLHNLDQFAYIAAFSGGGNRAEWEKADPAVLNQKLKVLWLGCGTEDPGYNGVKGMEELLTKQNIKHVWNQSGGGHSWPNWQVYLSKYAPLLFRE